MVFDGLLGDGFWKLIREFRNCNVDQPDDTGRSDVETRIEHEEAFAGALGV